MKILQTAQNHLAILGISPNQSLANVRFFIAEFLFLTTVASILMYIIYEANTFREYTLAIFLASTFIMVAVCFTLLGKERAHVFKMIDLGIVIIEKSSKTPSRRLMYEDTNRLANKWSQLSFIFLAIVTPIGFHLPKAIFDYFNYFTTDLGNDAFDLLNACWFPFDWKNPIGYAIAMFISFLMASNLFLFAACALSTGLGGILFTNAIMNDLKCYLIEINENANIKENHEQATQQFYDFVQMHSIVKQLFCEFFTIIEQMGMVFFTWTSVVVCGVMLQVQWEISKPKIDFMALMMAIGNAFDVFLSICVVCELGQRVTDIFTLSSDVIEQFDWYLHPKVMNRMLLTILPIVQAPVEIRCFGSIAANRKTFKKVANGGFSYFTVLRNFTK